MAFSSSSDEYLDGRVHGRRRSAQLASRVLFGATVLILSWIVAAPVVMLIYSSLTAEEGRLPFEAESLSFDNYMRSFLDLETYRLLGATAVFAVGSTIIGIVVAIFFAWLIERTDIWLRRTFFVVLLLPLAIPSMIYAMAWIQLLSPNAGLINVLFQKAGLGALQFDVFTLPSMILIQGLAIASHAYLLISVSFRNFDASWEEQSLICGRRQVSTLWQITLPMLKPALLAAGLFFLVVAMETFDIPVTIGLTSQVHVLSTRIYWMTHPAGGGLPLYGMASALSLLLIVIAFLLIQIYQRQTRSVKSFVTIAGKGYRPRRIKLGRWRIPLFVLAWLIVLVAVLLPVFMLVWRSLLSFYMFPSAQALRLVNLNAYRALLSDREMPQVLANTSIVASVSSVLVVILAAAVAWQIVRSPLARRTRESLTALSFFPQSLPSIVIGLALILVYLWLPMGIYGTVWIIIIAMVTKYVAYSTGAMIAAQMQIAVELEEASRVAGVGAFRTYRSIVAPLIWPAMVACFIWIFVHVVRELGLSLLLYSSQSQVLSTKIWLLWEHGRVGEAAAAGVLTMLLLVVLLAIPQLLTGVSKFAAALRSAWTRSRIGTTPIPGGTV